MWTDDQLDQATYEGYVDPETKQLMNVGTIEIQGTAYQGPYLMVPMPPFGSLKSGVAAYGGAYGVRVQAKRYTMVPMPYGFPSPAYKDSSVLHQYTLGDV